MRKWLLDVGPTWDFWPTFKIQMLFDATPKPN